MQKNNNEQLYMSQEEIRSAIEKSLRSPRLNELSPLLDNNLWKQQFDVLLDLCKGNEATAVCQQIKVILDYRQENFFRKFVCYICGLKDTTQEQRCKFADEIEKKADDKSGYVLMDMIDRLDNINKLTILANLTRARLDEFISIEQFFRLYSLLVRIPYVDLVSLSKYTTEYYDESGDTELLYATGALIQTSIDENGNSKFILSILGEELLIWGIKRVVQVQRRLGTNIALNTASIDTSKAIVDELV
jgi:hypothetical protein